MYYIFCGIGKFSESSQFLLAIKVSRWKNRKLNNPELSARKYPRLNLLFCPKRNVDVLLCHCRMYQIFHFFKMIFSIISSPDHVALLVHTYGKTSAYKPQNQLDSSLTER
jgi:hypothetical protein